MHRVNRRLCRVIRASIVSSIMLCTLVAGLHTPEVYAEASANGPQDNRAQDSSQQKNGTLAGSWTAVITLSDGTVFAALQAFTDGGQAFVTGQGDTIPPVLSPGLGSWKHVGGRTFAVTLIRIQYDTAGGPVGTLTGTLKITGLVTLSRSGDTFTARATVVGYDPAGNELFTADGDIWEGTRIQVEVIN